MNKNDFKGSQLPKWKSRSFTCQCHKIYRVEAIVKSLSNYTSEITIFIYEGHSVNSEIRYVIAIAYLLAESWCCLYKAPTFISHNTKETIS